METPRLLLVDDDRLILILLERTLREAGYQQLVTTQDPREVLDLQQETPFDLILLDLDMPYMTGYQVMQQLAALRETPPVLVLTAHQDQESRRKALRSGAKDYVTKPFDSVELLARVRNLVESRLLYNRLRRQKAYLEERVQERTRELWETRLQVVRRLGLAAEYRDNDTGMHILRMSRMSALLGQAIGLDGEQVDLLLNASPMHDIGKIGIPDAILLKPGKLTATEWEIMKTHTLIGANLLAGDQSNLMKMACQIALTHHERWDGSGYPQGLAGKNIPLAGRIVAVADVFDALISRRPYKKPWPLEEALAFIQREAGKHFDPLLAERFQTLRPQITEILQQFQDPEHQESLTSLAGLETAS